eukprot:706436-Hanusia_phi.AAC.1
MILVAASAIQAMIAPGPSPGGHDHPGPRAVIRLRGPGPDDHGPGPRASESGLIIGPRAPG